MCKPWNKLSKDEKLGYAEYKFKKGLGISIFGLVWHYLILQSSDVWGALPLSIAIIGVLIVILGLFKRLIA
jgi:hypothetical protein